MCVCERAIGYTTCLERLKLPQQQPWPTHRVRQLCQARAVRVTPAFDLEHNHPVVAFRHEAFSC